MNNLTHLGTFKVIDNENKYDFLLLNKYISVDFISDNDVTIKLSGGFVQSISYTTNGNIIIRLLSFSPLLYDLMINGNKIQTIQTREWRLDLKTHDEIECESIYHNFEFENYSVSEDIHNNNEYIYVLKGV